MSSSFTITQSNFQFISKMNEIVVGLNERILAAERFNLYPNDGVIRGWAKNGIVRYNGRVWRRLEGGDDTGVWDEDEWQELKALVGSNMQGRRYNHTYDMDWWGWGVIQSEIITICTSFVRKIEIDKQRSDPAGGIFNWIEMYTWDTLREDVNANDPDLFNDGASGVASDWTRAWRSGQNVVYDVGRFEHGDFITGPSVLIREIVGCLELLEKTIREYDRNASGNTQNAFDYENSGGVCSTERANHIAFWDSSMPMPVVAIGAPWRIRGRGKDLPSPTPGYEFESVVNDTLCAEDEIPIIQDVGYAWDMYAVSANYGGNTFEVPPSAAGRSLANFTANDECRSILNSTDDGTGDELPLTDTFVATNYIGTGISPVCPVEDFNIVCSDLTPDGTEVDKGFQVAVPHWVIDWDFTNQ